MAVLFLKLLNMSITAGWLILAITGLRLLFKRAPRWQICLLWSAVAIRLVFPFSLKSALSLIPSAQTISPDSLYAAKPEIHSGIPAVNSLVNPVIRETLAPQAGASVNPLQVWIQLAAYIWLVGLLLLFLYATFSYWRLRRKVRASLHLEDRVWICDEIDTPFILGLVRPRIYLPSGMEGGQGALVLAHERAHLKRRDHWWKPLGFLLLSIYWFNPLSWLAYLLLCRDIEIACDEKVIRTMGKGERVLYSEALLASSIPHRSIMACPLAFGELAVKERIRSVLHYKKPAFWIILLALIASIVLVVCFLTNPRDPAPDPDGPLAVEWFNYLHLDPDPPAWPESLETSLPEYPGVTFRWTPGELTATTREGTESLYFGMPIWNTFFCDLTGDGKGELCSTVSFGSGLIDKHVLVHDYENGTQYLLWHRGIHDYDLYLKEGHLYVAMRPTMKGEILESGQLVLEEGRLTIKGRPLPLPSLDPMLTKAVDYQAFSSEVGYSEEGYQVLVDRAESRDSERQYGNVDHLTPLVRLESRADLEALTWELSAYLDFDLKGPDSVAFSKLAERYTDDFFSDHSLFLAYLIAGSSADRFEMRDAFIEGGRLNLAIRQRQAEAGDGILSGWLLILEVKKSDSADCLAYDAYIAESVWPEDVWPAGGGRQALSYRYQGQGLADMATLRLFDSGDFILSLSPLSSYLAYGQYVIEGERLVLKTADGHSTYVFHKQAQGWSFSADQSSTLFASLSSLTEGSLFRLKERGPRDFRTLSDWWGEWNPGKEESASLLLTLYRYRDAVPSQLTQVVVKDEEKREDCFRRLLDLEILEVESPKVKQNGRLLELQFFNEANEPLLFLAFQVLDDQPDNLYINGDFLPPEETRPERTFLVTDGEGWGLYRELMELLD